MKKYIVECLGTSVLTFLGCGTAMFVGGALSACVWNAISCEKKQ